jgi:hypothetical protein
VGPGAGLCLLLPDCPKLFSICDPTALLGSVEFLTLILFCFLNRIERKIATISLESKSPPKTLENGEYQVLTALNPDVVK